MTESIAETFSIYSRNDDNGVKFEIIGSDSDNVLAVAYATADDVKELFTLSRKLNKACKVKPATSKAARYEVKSDGSSNFIRLSFNPNGTATIVLIDTDSGSSYIVECTAEALLGFWRVLDFMLATTDEINDDMLPSICNPFEELEDTDIIGKLIRELGKLD